MRRVSLEKRISVIEMSQRMSQREIAKELGIPFQLFRRRMLMFGYLGYEEDWQIF